MTILFQIRSACMFRSMYWLYKMPSTKKKVPAICFSTFNAPPVIALTCTTWCTHRHILQQRFVCSHAHTHTFIYIFYFKGKSFGIPLHTFVFMVVSLTWGKRPSERAISKTLRVNKNIYVTYVIYKPTVQWKFRIF